MEKNSVGTFLAALRKANGFTQKQMAEKLNVSDKAVSRWERDESAPDLMLIPVIAELFGITSDELLRGERISTPVTPSANKKVEKQVQYITKHTQTTYLTQCILSVCIALLAVLAAIIINYCFFRAILAFLVSCAFFLFAISCQSIFLLQTLQKLNCAEFPQEATAPAKRYIRLISQLSFGICGMLLTSCLPLVFFVPNIHLGLSFKTWAITGSICSLGFALLWIGIFTVINIKKGDLKLPDWQSVHAKLYLRYVRNTLLFLLLIAVLHFSAFTLLSRNYHAILQGKQFETWEDFRRYMETPTDTDGRPLTFLTLEGSGAETLYIYETQGGDTVVFRKSQVTEQLYQTVEDEVNGENPLISYRHLNQIAASIHLNAGGLPVQVFTQSQMQCIHILQILLHCLAGIIYFLTIIYSIKKYRKKVSQ